MADFYLIPKRVARRAPFLVDWAQRLEGGFFRLVFWLLRRMSLERASGLAASAFGLVGPHTDKAGKPLNNLAIAFPDSTLEWREQTVRGIFRHVGISAVELVKLDQIWEEREQRLEFFLEPAAREHLANKRATVFVCAHVGPWQITNLIAKHCGLTLSTVYAPESNPVMTDLLSGLRHAFGARLISSQAGVRPLIKELTDGHCIGLAMDTRLDTGKMIPFFGRGAPTNTSAAGLALRTGAALIPICAQRLPGSRFRINVYDPIQSKNPDSSPKAQALELTEAVNGYFEQWIREAPDEWICMKRRWPKDAYS